MTAAARLAFGVLALAAALPPQEPDRSRSLIADARKRLAAIGYDVPAGVQVVERNAKEVIADLDAQQEVLFPPDGFAVQFELRRAFGLAAQGASAMRAQAVASMARGASAFYDPIEKRFVLLPTATRDAAELLGGSLLPIVVHELVHGCQDARDGGLAKFFAARSATLDATLVRRCVIEGEAEVAAFVAFNGDGAVDRLVRRDQGDIEKVLAGELTSLFYQHGTRLAATRFRASGWPGVRELWQTPPPSCEQVMHAEKLGSDTPRAVSVPTIAGTEVLHRTTLGELMTYFMLRQRKLGMRDAALAAAGWDGDELVVLRANEGAAEGLVWRTVWDRDEDAAQFAAALPAGEHTSVATAGSSVDFVFAVDAALREKLTAACAAAKATPAADEADAASTAAVESALRSHDDASAVRDGKWELPELGLSVPVPATWELREFNGVKMLIDPATPSSGFAINVTVQALPRGPIADLDAMVTANRTQLERLKITIVRLATAKCGDVDVIRGEFEGRFGKTQPAVHCLQMIYLRGEQQVVVTATAAPKQMASHDQALRDLMDGILVTPAKN